MSRPSPIASGGLALLLTVAAIVLAPVDASDQSGVILGSHPVRATASTTLVLQPDGANSTDTFITDAPLWWNFGSNSSLLVGQNTSSTGVARSLLQFNLSGLPTGATVLNASLELYNQVASSGTIDAYRVAGIWTEGTSDRAWQSIDVTIRETAGVPRTLEPVPVDLVFSPYDVGDPARDVLVWNGSQEYPSQVYNYTVTGGHVTQATAYFGATIDANGTRDFVVTYSTNETTIPSYRLKGIGTAPLWTFSLTGTGASSPTVVDLLQDGSLEIVIGTSDGLVRSISSGGGSVWSTPLGGAIPFPPQVQDFDRDGDLDIVATNASLLFRLDEAGTIVQTFLLGSPPNSPPILLDVNGDGRLDALLATATGVQAYSLWTGAFLWSYPAPGGASAPSVADLDGDGVVEIVFGGEDGRIHAFDLAGAEWPSGFPGAGPIRNSVGIGDLDGDNLPEVVSGSMMPGGPEFAWDPIANSSDWSVFLNGSRRGHQTLVDIDGDGGLDVLVGTDPGDLFALNGSNGATLWSRFVGPGQVMAPAVADLDRDGRPEIVTMSEFGTQVQVRNSTGGLIQAWNITPNEPGGPPLQPDFVTPAIADLDGDGTLEIIVSTGTDVQVFATGGLSRDWRAFGYNWNRTHRVGDGSSPDGAPPLSVTLGIPDRSRPAGATWLSPDGTQFWFSNGGDYVTLEDSVPTGPGWLVWNVTAAVTDWYLGSYPNNGFLLREQFESTGVLHVFHSSDSGGASLRPVLRITYTPPFVDPVPQILGSIQDFARSEDSARWTTSLSGLAFDADTPLSELRWNVSGHDPSVVQITGVNFPGQHDLEFLPVPNGWGSALVTYWLSDPEGNAAWQEAWINITPVNDAPRFDPPTTLVVKYDLSYVFDFSPYIEDIDDPPASLTLGSDDVDHTTVSEFNVSFLYPISYIDRWVFVGLTLSDGRAAVGKVVAVKVTQDDPPVLTTALPDLTIQEGETLTGVFDLDGYFFDPNNDTLFFSYGYSHLTIAIHADHTVDISAESDWFGAERVTFRGTDPFGALVEDTIVVTVLPVNDPPVLGPIPDLRVHYDANYTFNVEPYVSDPDTPLGGILMTASSSYATASGRVLTLLYPFSLNGTIQSLTISVSDGTSTASRTISVTIGDDWPPILTGELGDRSFLEDGTILGAYDLRTSFTDPDDATLYFSSGNVNVLVSISSLGIVNLSSTPDWFGAEWVTFRATDSLGALAEDTVSIAVLPVNDAPWFRAIPTVYLNESAGVLDLTPFLVDVDTNLSDLTVTSASVNVTAVGRSLIFSYRTDTVERFEVVARDGFLEGRAFVDVVVRLPRNTERLPPTFWWLLGIGGVAAAIAVAIWRYRRVEWVFLITNSGMLLASVFRRAPATVDTDLMAGMMTAIMDFAKVSFSDEKSRELDQFSLGDRRVELVQGKEGYLAVVYAGRTPGGMSRIMGSLLVHIEQRYPGAFSGVVDMSTFRDIPVLLKRFMDRAWWPFLTFKSKKTSDEAP